MGRAWLGWVALASLATTACGGDPFTTGSADATDGAVTESGTDAQAVDSSRERDSRADSSGDASAEASALDASTDASTDASADTGDDGHVTVVGDAGSITGKVIDSVLVPIPGVQVHVGAQTATTATDGTFSLTGVVAPYDVTVVTPGASGHQHGYVFQQLTTADPYLQLALESPRYGKTTSIQSGAPASPGVTFVDVGPLPTRTDWGPTAAGSPFSASWVGASPLAATAYVLQWSESNTTGLPGAYTWYASQPIQVADGQTESLPAIVPGSTPNVSTVTLNTSLAFHKTVSDVWCFYRPAAGVVVAPKLFDDRAAKATSPAVTGYAVPDVAASGNTLVVCAQTTAGTSVNGPRGLTTACEADVAPGAGSVSLTLPAIPLLTGPPATGVTTSTTFAWTAAVTGVHMAQFTSTAAGAPAFAVITMASTAHIPDLSAYGLSLPPQTGYSVVITETALPGLTGIDSAVGPRGFATMGAEVLQNRGPVTGGSVATSDTATFSTQ